MVADGADPIRVKAELKRLLRDKFDLRHTVLELESVNECCTDAQRIGHNSAHN